ncbi:MAG: hypothetical protein ACYTG0_08970 [Planctomycetota bacterium]|jgi:hypothetical protein
MTRDKLDKLLEQWAARHAIDEDHARELTDRIVDRLPRGGRPTDGVAAGRRVSTPSGKRMVYAALGTAAVLLIGMGVFFLSGFLTPRDDNQEAPPSRPSPDSEAAALSVARISQSEIEDGTRLFQEFQRLFAADLRWISDTDAGVRLDVRTVSGGPAARATPLLIRVLVVERDNGEDSWHKVLEADVLTRGQELVEAVPDPKLDNRLLLWGYSLPDGKVAVDSSIRLTTPIRVSVDVTNVFTPGKPANVFSLDTEDAEYRVFQVVTPLPKHEDASCSET